MKIIYHGNCLDGFGSALVAWTQYRSEADYIPAYHNVDPVKVHDDDVLMVDFAYDYEPMVAIQETNRSFTVIDHHTGMFPVLEKLETLHDTKVYKDRNHSGAVLMWKYMHGDKPVPLLLQYIEDQDCHFNRIPEASAAMMWSSTHPFKFELWQAFLNFDAAKWEKVIRFNQPMVKKVKAMINRAADQSVATKLAGYPARICFGTEEQASDIACEMAQRCNGIGIVGVVQSNGGIKTSLRSVGIDLVPIAQALKGNGHSYAAAFPANPVQLADMLKGNDILACQPQQMFLSV